jgi:hypothetical protein
MIFALDHSCFQKPNDLPLPQLPQFAQTKNDKSHTTSATNLCTPTLNGTKQPSRQLLLIDDDQYMSEALAEFLAPEGYARPPGAHREGRP